MLPALAALVAILVVRRREPRTDPWRAAAVLWGLWLFLTAAFFAGSQSFHPYYLAGLAPPLAALCGMGLALAWRLREQSPAVAIVMMATVVAGVVYAVSLVPDDVGVRPWIIASSVAVAIGAVACLLLSLRPERRGWELDGASRCRAAALLFGAAWASGTAVASELGPFDSAYQPASLTAASQTGWGATSPGGPRWWPAPSRSRADQSIKTAGDLCRRQHRRHGHGPRVSGRRGVHRTASRRPRWRSSSAYVARRRVVGVLVGVRPRTRNPDMLWVLAHCHALTGPRATVRISSGVMHQYVCAPSDAGG